jgi:hypothetical protein
MFDIVDILTVDDHYFITRSDSSLPALIIKLELALDAITKWLRNSGLKVNKVKNEACLFFRKY